MLTVYGIYGNIQDMCDYIVSPEKTGEKVHSSRILKSAFYCSFDSCEDDFIRTRNRFKRDERLLAVHMIQAFVPGEIEPDDIHRLGKRFLSRFFENEYQMIIGTHVDTEKPHNHMLVNSVNRITGRMLDFSINARKKMERYSDALYEEMGLTKVPYTRHVDYSHEMFWQIIHDMKCEIDLALSQNRSYEEMLEQLKGKGYELMDYPMEHYHVARIRGYQTRVHLKYLGYDYSKKRLMERTNERTILAVAPSMRHEIERQSPGMRTRKDYTERLLQPPSPHIF